VIFFRNVRFDDNIYNTVLLYTYCVTRIINAVVITYLEQCFPSYIYFVVVYDIYIIRGRRSFRTLRSSGTSPPRRVTDVTEPAPPPSSWEKRTSRVLSPKNGFPAATHTPVLRFSGHYDNYRNEARRRTRAVSPYNNLSQKPRGYRSLATVWPQFGDRALLLCTNTVAELRERSVFKYVKSRNVLYIRVCTYTVYTCIPPISV